jgi:hypothetical protein
MKKIRTEIEELKLDKELTPHLVADSIRVKD